MKKKSIIFAIVAVIVLALILGVCFYFKGHNDLENQNMEMNSGEISGENFENNFEENVSVNDGVKVNVSENINQKVIAVEELELSNISLKYTDGLTHFTADVKNNSTVDYINGAEMLITFYNEGGNVIYSVPVTTSTLLAGGTSNINSKTTIDCSNAHDISISIIK